MYLGCEILTASAVMTKTAKQTPATTIGKMENEFFFIEERKVSVKEREKESTRRKGLLGGYYYYY